jgi:CheY-like chemotaxis protein
MSAQFYNDPAAFNGHAILLVDDNEDDAVILQRAFQKAAVPNPVQIVPDVQTAMAYLDGKGVYKNRQRYFLPIMILLDLGLPGKNGVELLRWLRQHPSLHRTTVHVLTGSTRGDDVEKAFDAGANAYLVKPNQFDALVEMVKAWYSLNQFMVFPALQEDTGAAKAPAAICRSAHSLAF